MFLNPFPYYIGYHGQNTAIPSLYWNEWTAEQRIECICETLRNLECYAQELGVQVNLDIDTINDVLRRLEELEDGKWFDLYADELREWINENMVSIISDAIKMVWFGLTDTGYFVAYIPESWDDITFDTGMQYGKFDYGRLILRYQVNAPGVIDNTGRYDDIPDVDELRNRVASMERTLYAPMSEGGDI